MPCRFLTVQVRVFGPFALANVTFCSFEKPVRNKGFIVHFASVGPGLSFVPPSVARAGSRGSGYVAGYVREADSHR